MTFYYWAGKYVKASEIAERTDKTVEYAPIREEGLDRAESWPVEQAIKDWHIVARLVEQQADLLDILKAVDSFLIHWVGVKRPKNLARIQSETGFDFETVKGKYLLAQSSTFNRLRAEAPRSPEALERLRQFIQYCRKPGLEAVKQGFIVPLDYPAEFNSYVSSAYTDPEVKLYVGLPRFSDRSVSSWLQQGQQVLDARDAIEAKTLIKIFSGIDTVPAGIDALTYELSKLVSEQGGAAPAVAAA
jgi:hypothetical protein